MKNFVFIEQRYGLLCCMYVCAEVERWKVLTLARAMLITGECCVEDCTLGSYCV